MKSMQPFLLFIMCVVVHFSTGRKKMNLNVYLLAASFSWIHCFSIAGMFPVRTLQMPSIRGMNTVPTAEGFLTAQCIFQGQTVVSWYCNRRYLFPSFSFFFISLLPPTPALLSYICFLDLVRPFLDLVRPFLTQTSSISFPFLSLLSLAT